MTTFPLNLLFGLLCGGCLGGCAGPQPGLGWRRLLPLPLLFAVLSVLPAATYLALQFPDWTFSYLINPRRLPRLWGLGVGTLTAGAVVAGFALWVHGARRFGAASPRLILGLGAVGVTYLSLVALSLWSGRLSATLPPLAVSLSLDAGSDAAPLPPLLGGPIGTLYPLLAINLFVGAALVVVARALRTKGELLFFARPGAGPGPGPGIRTQPTESLATTS